MKQVLLTKDKHQKRNSKISLFLIILSFAFATLFIVNYLLSLQTKNEWRYETNKNDETANFSNIFLTTLQPQISYPIEAPKQSNRNESLPVSQREIVIGAVICRKPEDYGPRVETAVMIKSVIISSLIYKQVSKITFNLFIEYLEDKEYFVEKLAEYGYPYSKVTDNPPVEIIFHSVVDAMPKEYHHKMIYSNIRCAYIRCFFPIILPDLDSILYLDTDAIVIGNIAEIWSTFDKMEGEQLIGAVMDFEPENPNFDKDHYGAFGDIPIPTPKGLNTGVLMMNLTKMRINNWAEKALQAWFDYEASRPVMEDQRLINILLFYDSGLLKLLPCNFNFRPAACIYGLYCTASTTDPLGIQIIHWWYDPNWRDWDTCKTFYDIAHQYQIVNLTDPNLNLFRDLMNPIKNAYSEVNADTNLNDHFQCDGVINKLLFKNYFE